MNDVMACLVVLERRVAIEGWDGINKEAQLTLSRNFEIACRAVRQARAPNTAYNYMKASCSVQKCTTTKHHRSCDGTNYFSQHLA